MNALYDPTVESHLVAARAFWLLFLWAKWNEIEQLGVRREDIEPLLHLFEAVYIQREGGKLTNEEEVFALLRTIPELVGIVIGMVGLYQLETKATRREHYGISSR